MLFFEKMKQKWFFNNQTEGEEMGGFVDDTEQQEFMCIYKAMQWRKPREGEGGMEGIDTCPEGIK